MNLKKIKIINVFGVFLLSFLAHNMYKWCPNTFTSIFFPVNESIFEHMKILATCFLFYGIFEFFIIKHFNIEINNYLFSCFLSILLGIIVYLIVFVPIHLFISRSMFIPIILLFLVYIFMNFISYYILSRNKIPYIENISIFLIIALYLVFGYLTYRPPHIFLFFDTVEEKYGVNEYLV